MMRTPCQALVLLAASLLGGCALGSSGSYVANLRAPADAQVLASGMVDFVAAELPAASSTISLDPTPSGQQKNALTPALLRDLRQRGFAIADGNQADQAGIHHLRYLVTPLEGGVLVRLSIDDRTQAARFFAPNTAGSLQAGGPFMVRRLAEVGQ
jgi:hypothetical protein